MRNRFLWQPAKERVREKWRVASEHNLSQLVLMIAFKAHEHFPPSPLTLLAAFKMKE